MLCHAGINGIECERMKRMNDREPGQDSVHTTPAGASYHEAHRSYLLRLWRTGADGSWRASLQSIPAGDRHMFADLDSLLAFLINHSWAPPGPIRRDQPAETSTD
jgi:hypothetical protein